MTVNEPSSWVYPMKNNAKIKADGVVQLVQVKADLSQIPIATFPKLMGADGQFYYRVCIDVEVTYYSAYTSYELIYQGKNYGPVRVEYV